MFGKVLGDIIKDVLGENIFDCVEIICKLFKFLCVGNEVNCQELLIMLQNLFNDELLLVVCVFSQFLNLVNIVEQYYSILLNGEVVSNLEVIVCILRKFKD